MDHFEKELLIRHDEQLKSLAALPMAVNELATQLRVANARARDVALVIGGFSSIVSCIGTWIVIAHFSH
jgi:hypothetical protein